MSAVSRCDRARGDSNKLWHGGHYNIVSGLDSLRSDELGWRKLERDDTGDTRDPGADNTSHVIITGHQAQQVGGCCQHPPTWVAVDYIKSIKYPLMSSTLTLSTMCKLHWNKAPQTFLIHLIKDTKIPPSLHSSSFIRLKFVFAVLDNIQSS